MCPLLSVFYVASEKYHTPMIIVQSLSVFCAGYLLCNIYLYILYFSI